MLHFNPDSGNPLVLLFFNSSKLFPLGFFLGMHISTFRPTKLFRIPERCVSAVWNYDQVIYQVSLMCTEESPKEGESTCWLEAGSFQTVWHGVPEGDWSSDIPR